MSGFAEKLNVQICENSLGNCIFPVRNFWICRKIEYPKLRKFNGKLCTLHTYGRSGFAEKLNVQNSGNSTGNSVRYMYGMSKFAKKLNIPNSENSTGNCVHYLCTACLDLLKNSKSKTAEIQFEIVDNTCTECLDLQKN